MLLYTSQFGQAQSNLVLIEEKYNQLDSVCYIDNIKDTIDRYSMHAFGELNDWELSTIYCFV